MRLGEFLKSIKHFPHVCVKARKIRAFLSEKTPHFCVCAVQMTCACCTFAIISTCKFFACRTVAVRLAVRLTYARLHFVHCFFLRSDLYLDSIIAIQYAVANSTFFQIVKQSCCHLSILNYSNYRHQESVLALLTCVFFLLIVHVFSFNPKQ